MEISICIYITAYQCYEIHLKGSAVNLENRSVEMFETLEVYLHYESVLSVLHTWRTTAES